MKNIFLFLCTLLLFFKCSKENVHWSNSTLEEALEISDNKLIMIDFYTDW